MFPDNPVLAWLFISISFAQLIRLIRMRRDHLRRYREVPYDAPDADAPDAWRWQKPPGKLHLEVINTAGESRLVLPSRLAGLELAGAITGFVVIAGALGLVAWVALARGPGAVVELPVIVLTFLVVLAGYGLLHLGSRALSIELREEDFTIVTRMGVIFVKRHRFRHAKMRGGTAKGHLQAVASMTLWQRQPAYWLFVGRAGGLRPARRYMTSCNQSQGSWIVGGLEAWMRPRQAEA